jgi:hypothetical protein
VSLSRDGCWAAAKLLPTANWNIEMDTSPVRTTLLAADAKDFMDI